MQTKNDGYEYSNWAATVNRPYIAALLSAVLVALNFCLVLSTLAITSHLITHYHSITDYRTQ